MNLPRTALPSPDQAERGPFLLVRVALAVGLLGAVSCVTAAGDEPLKGTSLLNADRPLDQWMIEGIDRFALREIAEARKNRESHWQRNFDDANAYEKSIAPNRHHFRTIIGAVDRRVEARGLEWLATSTQPSLVAETDSLRIHAVRWQVFDGVTAEGLFLQPKGDVIARWVAIPDADVTPEMISGMGDSDSPFALHLAAMGCEVLVPTLISRSDAHSGNPEIGIATNQTHREFIYRQAFELGRHVIGYEVQKILSAVDQLELREHGTDLPIGVAGFGEGGLLALYSAALDSRIDTTVVSGYFDQRESVWEEPIYRNVWQLLTRFGDAEIAGMIAPRSLWIESSPKIDVTSGPLPVRAGRRGGAAPGALKSPDSESVRKEFQRAAPVWKKLGAENELHWVENQNAPPLPKELIGAVLSDLVDRRVTLKAASGPLKDARTLFSDAERQHRQVEELVRHTQRILALSHRTRDQRFGKADRTSVETWTASAGSLREHVYDELIGRLPNATVAPNPRTREVLREDAFVGYEVVLDVFPDVIAPGILLLPRDLRPGERRPVVVCQHGLEGTPMDTITDDPKPYRAYKSFSADLARRGFIVYAPQNPYRGRDAFRTLQRKSNPLGRSLFSYIVPQHLVTLRWLASLPNVDKDRIGFYGLSYGGKTAVRVPPLLPPTATEPGYCFSICSADFNEWVSKNASTDARFSYIWTGEYEIFEWNMGHVANYAELAMLMTPRPFMVERGHDDGVGIDEWVAWEFAKVRRHYNKLGIGDRTEIEFFNGPHTINGKGTYDFIHRHLKWPKTNR